MFCKRCGAELVEGAVYCANCGEPVEKEEEEKVVSEQTGDGHEECCHCEECEHDHEEECCHCEECEAKEEPKLLYNTFAIVGFVLAFFQPVLGLIFSCIGYSQSTKRPEKGTGLAIAGIIISIIAILSQILVVILNFSVFAAIIAGLGSTEPIIA